MRWLEEGFAGLDVPLEALRHLVQRQRPFNASIRKVTDIARYRWIAIFGLTLTPYSCSDEVSQPATL